MKIDKLINKLRSLTDNFLFIEYYSHENFDCYKILDEYSNFKETKIVLCRIDEGFELALRGAIKYFKTIKQKDDDTRNRKN